jgi:hypothetical protein
MTKSSSTKATARQMTKAVRLAANLNDIGGQEYLSPKPAAWGEPNPAVRPAHVSHTHGKDEIAQERAVRPPSTLTTRSCRACRRARRIPSRRIKCAGKL